MIIDRDKICWLLVCDGASAHFHALQNRPLHIEPIPSPPLRNHAHERHGAIPQEKEDRFAVQVAEAVATAASKKLFQTLVLVAPPHMLGELRQDLAPEIRKMIILEIAGEWANMTPTEIAVHLKPHLMPAH
ncbi:MAG: host attachment protein [Rhodospirillaceae bacterium]